MQYFRCLGFTLGLLVQCISLGAVTWMGWRWGQPDEENLIVPEDEKIFYYVLWLASRLALAIWPLVWMAPFVMSMTEFGEFSGRGVHPHS